MVNPIDWHKHWVKRLREAFSETGDTQFLRLLEKMTSVDLPISQEAAADLMARIGDEVEEKTVRYVIDRGMREAGPTALQLLEEKLCLTEDENEKEEIREVIAELRSRILEAER